MDIPKTDTFIDRLIRVWMMQQRWDINTNQMLQSKKYGELKSEYKKIHKGLDAMTFEQRRELLWTSWKKETSFLKVKAHALQELKKKVPSASKEDLNFALDTYHEALDSFRNFLDTLVQEENVKLFFTEGECALLSIMTKDEWVVMHLTEEKFITPSKTFQHLQAIDLPADIQA